MDSQNRFDSAITLASQHVDLCNPCERRLQFRGSLKQVALTGGAGASHAWFRRSGWTLDGRAVFSPRTNTAVGKFNLERHARADGCGRAQRTPLGIAHQSKSARQHASIRESRKKLAAALGTR